MSTDPWRLPTEAATRAAVQCFRLPELRTAAGFGAFGDPQILLERFLGGHLPMAEHGSNERSPSVPTAPGAGTAQLPSWQEPAGGTSLPGQASHAHARHPRSSEPAGLPDGRWDASTGGAVGQSLPSEAARLPDDRPRGSAGRAVGQSSSSQAAEAPVGGRIGQPPLSQAAGTSEERHGTSARTVARQASALENPAPHDPADAWSHLTPAGGTGNANHGTGTGPMAPLSAGLEDAEAATRVAEVPVSAADHAAAPHSTPQPETSVTRLGRGAAQLAAVLRADADAGLDPVDRPPIGSPSRNAPIDDLVATFTEEVAGRLRDELEWEFQRTYGTGG
jgi:hypothetical protein